MARFPQSSQFSTAGPCHTCHASNRATYEKFADGTAKDISGELPFDLPQGWTWARISGVFDVARGGSPRPIKAYITTNDDGLNWIKIGDATIGSKYIFSTEQKIRPDGLKKTRAVYSGDLLLTNSMSFGHPYILKTSGCIHDGWLVLHPLDDEINKEFFYYLLSSKFAYSQFAKAASGGVVQNLNTDKVFAAIFPLPPPSEQKRIVTKIEELLTYADKVGEVSEEISLTTQRLDKKILDLAIRGKLVPQDPDDEPASELLKRIEAAKKATEKGHKSSRTAASDRPAYEIEPPFDIPDLWEWVRLGDALLPMETKRPQGETFQYIDIDAIDNTNNVVLSPKRLPVAKAPSRASRGLKSGDTLFSVVRPYLRNIAYIDDSLADCIASTGFYVCRPDEMVAPRFLFWLLLSDYVVNGLNSFMKGDNSPSIRGEQLHDFLVPLPPIAEQKRIVAKIEELRAMTRSLTK